MQVDFGNDLDRLAPLGPDEEFVSTLKSSGFDLLYERIAGKKVRRLREARAEFTEWSHDDVDALTFDATRRIINDLKHFSGSLPTGRLWNGELIAARFDQRIRRARELKLDVRIWEIKRNEGTVEWALVGETVHGAEKHTFVLARWGMVVEDVNVLVNRRDVALYTRESERKEVERKREAEKRRYRRIQHCKDFAIILVPGTLLIAALWLVRTKTEPATETEIPINEIITGPFQGFMMMLPPLIGLLQIAWSLLTWVLLLMVPFTIGARRLFVPVAATLAILLFGPMLLAALL